VNPKKDYNSLMFLGAGHARMTSTLPLSMATPLGDIITPKYLTEVSLNELFSDLA
jgi:hypothetical protein